MIVVSVYEFLPLLASSPTTNGSFAVVGVLANNKWWNERCVNSLGSQWIKAKKQLPRVWYFAPPRVVGEDANNGRNGMLPRSVFIAFFFISAMLKRRRCSELNLFAFSTSSRQRR